MNHIAPPVAVVVPPSAASIPPSSHAPQGQVIGVPLPSQPLHLINLTAHSQTREAFAEQGKKYPYDEFGITFVNPADPICRNIEMTRPLKNQLQETWERALHVADLALASPSAAFDGFFLGGYGPIIGPLAIYLHNERQRLFVAIQGPSEMVNGKPRGYHLGGIRRIQKRLLVRPNLPKKRFDPSHLVHMSSFPLTEERKANFRLLDPRVLLGTPPIPPPPSGASCEEYIERVEGAVFEAFEQGYGILLDGVATENLCYVIPQARVLGVPLYFTRTDPALKSPTNLAAIAAIEPFPVF